jgi:hypothetical protein
VVERTGGRPLVERLRLEWRPGTPLPEPTPRLAFRPFHGTEEVLALMTSALTGTLDAHSRDDLTRMTAREAAAKHYGDELARYTTPRAWWQVATLPDGEPVGFVIPAHNGYNPVIAYVAVLPAHRGHAYIDAPSPRAPAPSPPTPPPPASVPPRISPTPRWPGPLGGRGMRTSSGRSRWHGGEGEALSRMPTPRAWPPPCWKGPPAGSRGRTPAGGLSPPLALTPTPTGPFVS